MTGFRTVDLIRAVRDAQGVRPEDLQPFIRGLVSEEIPDYQAAAFLMAVYCNGLPDQATVALTLAMRDSGQVIRLPEVPAVKVDKHSTGGVGDKISLPLAPLVAACGVPVPMISGRGLGHTGGTLDKLESITGFNVHLGIEQYKRQVAELGLCLIGQTKDLAPADRKLYALRDVTATVESIPLITSSILAKKLAEGIDALVLDVKVGRGAFMKDEASARALAESLVRVGTGAGLKVRALLTRMEEPLGRTIGNALEVRESLEILAGAGPEDTSELTLALGAEMLVLGGVAGTLDDARSALRQAMLDGSGLAKFRAVIEAQGGDPAVVDHPDRLPTAKQRYEVLAGASGIVQSVDSMALGMSAMRLGAGRATMTDTIDAAVGIEVLTRPGDKIMPDQPLARIHHNRELGGVEQEVREAFVIGEAAPKIGPLIIDQYG